MIFRFGWKSFQRDKLIKGMIILLLVATFLIVMTAVSMVELKLKQYLQVSDALHQKGRVIINYGLYDPETGATIKDAEDLKSHVPQSDNIWSVARVFISYYNDASECNVWIYNKPVIDMLSPDLEEGRWFQPQDMQSDTLKAVVSQNGGQIKAGDIVAINDPDMGVEVKLEIIGVMEDRQSLFGINESNGDNKDYRMMFTPYSYTIEGNVPLFILAEQQVLENQNKGWFEEFNFRLNNKKGFIKNVSECTIITYPDSVSEEDIGRDMELLRKQSLVNDIYRCEDVRRASIQYVMQELYSMTPIVICIMIYIIMATLSISAITVKSNLRNYAAYYLCGMQWRQCSMISLAEACIIGGISLILTMVSMIILSVRHMLADSALHLGVFQLIACMVILVLYVFLAWLIPRNIVKKTSAKEILRDN